MFKDCCNYKFYNTALLTNGNLIAPLLLKLLCMKMFIYWLPTLMTLAVM
jgi:hypothetical protein